MLVMFAILTGCLPATRWRSEWRGRDSLPATTSALQTRRLLLWCDRVGVHHFTLHNSSLEVTRGLN